MNITGNVLKIDPGSKFWAEVIELDSTYFPRPWKPQEWEKVDFSHHGLWVLVENEKVIALALFSLIQGDVAHLLKILIQNDRRGSGLAQVFWNELSQLLRDSDQERVYLEVEESNLVARKFYEKLGFEVIHRVKGYYSDGENALMMQLML